MFTRAAAIWCGRRAARDPEGGGGDRPEAHERVAIETGSRRHLIRHRVTCRELGAEDGAICEAGRRDGQGFLEPVRTLEVCNHGGAPFHLAVAGETRDGRAWRVDGWRAMPAGQCVDVWRGQTGSGLVHVRARAADGAPIWDRDDARLCIPDTEDFMRVADSYFERGCAAAGEAPAGFRTVRFNRGVSRFTLDFRGADEN